MVALLVVLSMILTACNSNPLQDTVDEINADESMHAALEGLYTVHADTQGDSTIVVTFQAELEDLASPEVAEAVSDGVVSEFQDAVQEMQKAGISDPAIVLEFLDTGGNLIYARKFS